MKNKTLLKVLSASAIFTAIAAIESYDHNAFATEVAATATNNQSDVETKTVPQDVKNLPDGTYDIKSEAFKFYGKDGDPSMASAGLDKDNTKLIVKNGQYSVNVNFKPIDLFNQKGYLGDLKYYDGDKTHSNRYDIQDNEFKDTTIVENYSENEKDAFIDVYKKKFPGRTVYPKTLSYNVDKNKIDANNKLETYTQVFVPVMEAFPTGSGTQRMILEYNLNSLTTKTITEPKYNLVPLTMMDATANTKSMGDGAIDKSKTRVEKVGDTYHYYVTAKDLAFGPYVGELTNLTVNGTTATLTELGGSNHEKLYHFTSKEKYDVVNVTVDVDAGGRPFHKNTPARFAFDWAKATPLTKAIVNQLQNEEKAKANEKVATDKKAKEEKARIEAEKLAKEKAEKERIEREKLAKEKAEKERIEREKLAKEKAEKERIEAEKLAKEKAEKERLEREKPPVTAKGEPAIEEKPEFDLDGFISNHKGPITVKGEATILEKPEFDLDGYLREQKRLTEETTTTSDKKPLINDIFGQSEVKDTFVATPVSTKKSNVTTVNVKKSLANTGVNTATTGFFGLVTLLSAFILRRKTNK
ncbi:NEAT domain-containing protein [uncultured Gemella sp.]|uniref:NEAT domain-containing protein n=1 Tax=uncultured Gemella sp. TaxID=254352 RepID=UPI0025F01818|nr:NEAT domain-containing protein [uncultured Gemella sp.]